MIERGGINYGGQYSVVKNVKIEEEICDCCGPPVKLYFSENEKALGGQSLLHDRVKIV